MNQLYYRSCLFNAPIKSIQIMIATKAWRFNSDKTIRSTRITKAKAKDSLCTISDPRK